MYLVQFCHYQRMPENAFLPNTKIFHKTSVQIMDLGLGIGQECILNALNAF